MATLTQGFLKLQLNMGSSSPNWQDIPGVTVANGLGMAENRVNVTDFDTTPGSNEYMSGPRDPNPLSFTMHYEQGNTQQEALFTAEAANEELEFRLLFGAPSGGKQIVFEGVPSLQLGAPVNGVTTYSGTVTPLQAPVRGNAS